MRADTPAPSGAEPPQVNPPPNVVVVVDDVVVVVVGALVVEVVVVGAVVVVDVVVVVVVVGALVVVVVVGGTVVVVGGDVVVVVVGIVVVVLVVAPAVQPAGYGVTSSGTAAASVQSVLNSATQSMHRRASCRSKTGPPQLEPARGETSGQVVANPMSAGAKSPTPLHRPSGPPHALQMVLTFRASALAMNSAALPSPGSGHGFECLPRSRASQHSCSTFDRVTMNFEAPLLIACWQRFEELEVPNSPASKAPA
jgi:hypothetical protein